MGQTEKVHTVVIGASAAGLATAACLKRQAVESVVLEQRPHVAHAWRNHYRRLHLHTPRFSSGLPGLPMPRKFPLYPTRDQVVEYLESYAKHHAIKPRFETVVRRVARNGDGWLVETEQDTLKCQNVVVATGYTRTPHVPQWPGDVAFEGELLHSSRYDTGAAYVGKRVLVVGFGNSAGEIAIDLCEQGAAPSMAVHSAVNVIPRDLLGVPILGVGILLSALPPKLADRMNAPLMRAVIGDIEALGLKKLPYGPITQIREKGRIPLLDIGTIRLIREGKITVYGGIERFEGRSVVFDDGKRADFDVVVLATGYRPALSDFLEPVASVTDDTGTPTKSGYETEPGLFFCGFYVSPTGMLREIGIEAKRIAHSIAQSN